MCGIAGIISKNEEELKNISKMCDTIIHRGPDGHGYYYDQCFALGHRRLAIVDLTEHGAQPMEYMEKYVITYNGEIYNYIELREELIKEGYKFNSECDTEVIMAAYDYWGEECLNRFNGMWAFALYDKEKNIILCARDRFGVKPFYYMQLTDKFLFASEIKAFTVFHDWKPAANKKRLLDFFMQSIFDHTHETFFKNVYQIRGGEKLTYDLKTANFEASKWYSLEEKLIPNSISLSAAIDRFKEIFTDSVRLRLRSDVKVGSCLSGGLDSSSIVCVANKLLRETNKGFSQETVSSCFDIKKYDEQEYIDEVVKETGVVSHKIFPQFDDLFDDLDKIAWHQDEPYGSTSIYSQWNVFKAAKSSGITVMLDGQGADEQLAGYDGFFTANLNELFRKGHFIRLYKEAKAFKRIFGKTKFNPLIGMCYSILSYYFPNLSKTAARKILSGNQMDWLDKGQMDKVTLSSILKHSQLSIINNSMQQLIYTSLPALLHYEDRDSMAHSIESRVPFLDYRLVEFVIGLPDSFKINNARTKHVLREAMKGIIPDRIYNRHDKLGFMSPEEVWIRDNPEVFREELIQACGYLPSMIDQIKVLQWYDERLNSNKSFGYSFWKIISVGRWMKVFGVERI
jgi:asparagine synthase (glutamine-hydrolysing)